MDNRCEYGDKLLLYSVDGGELRINTLDLCSLLGIETEEPKIVDLGGAG